MVQMLSTISYATVVKAHDTVKNRRIKQYEKSFLTSHLQSTINRTKVRRIQLFLSIMLVLAGGMSCRADSIDAKTIPEESIEEICYSPGSEVFIDYSYNLQRERLIDELEDNLKKETNEGQL